MVQGLSIKRPIIWLICLQAAISIFCLLIIATIFFLYNKAIAQHKFITHIYFPMLLVIAGILGGMQFLCASESYVTLGKGVKETAAILYGTDLIGSAMGAFLTGLILLPILGIPSTLLILFFLNLLASLLLFSIDQMPGMG